MVIGSVTPVMSHLLERIGADQLAADLAGDADDRRGIHHRGGDAGDHVGGAGTGCRDGHADAAARARIAVGHVRGALLVANQDVVDVGYFVSAS